MASTGQSQGPSSRAGQYHGSQKQTDGDCSGGRSLPKDMAQGAVRKPLTISRQPVQPWFMGINLHVCWSVLPGIRKTDVRHQSQLVV